MATETEQLPHLQIFHRVCEIPVVEYALEKSASTYHRVKDTHQLVHWAFSTAEYSLNNITKQAVPIAKPLAQKFRKPINFVDNTLCLGLDKIEQTVPVIKDKSEQMLENAYMMAITGVQPAVHTISYVNKLILKQANSMKNVSWKKVNQILNTHYGTAAVHGVDNAAGMVNHLLNKYFPAMHDEKDIEPCSAEEDQLLHTLQTVGRLSNKAARRIYAHVRKNLRILRKDQLKVYISSLVKFLHLTHYINVMNDKVQAITDTEKTADHNDKTEQNNKAERNKQIEQNNQTEQNNQVEEAKQTEEEKKTN